MTTADAIIAPLSSRVPDPEMSVPMLMSAKIPPVICVAGVMTMVRGATAPVTKDVSLSIMTRSSQTELTKPENDRDSEDVAAAGGVAAGTITGEDVSASDGATTDVKAVIGEDVAIMLCVPVGFGVAAERANGRVAKATPPTAKTRRAAAVYAITRVDLLMD